MVGPAVAYATDPRVDSYIGQIAIREGDAINAPALSAIFKQIIAYNRAGGWRKLKRAQA